MHLEALQELALRLSGERSVDAVLQFIVDGLAQQSGVALARVWVTGPGDVCSSCRMRPACPDQTVCLHLSASAGTSLEGEQWSRIDGYFSRVPFGDSKTEFCPRPVSTIATARTGQLLPVPSCKQWAHPEWIQQEAIAELCGSPAGLSRRNPGRARRVPQGTDQRAGIRLAADVCESGGRRRRQRPRLLRTRQTAPTARVPQCLPERGGRQRLQLWRDRRPQPRASSCPAAGRRCGIDWGDGADYRRVWYGQGTARERDSRTWTTVTAAVCAGQLQRHPARDVRERVLRPRARGVHGRRARPARPLPDRRWRHDFSR